VPCITSFATFLAIALFHAHAALAPWTYRYTGTFFCLLLLTPFLLRWCAKPRFSRTIGEAIETIGVLLVLILIDFCIFAKDITSLGGIPLVYFLLVPLFWIALRLRPRFVTLALLITSVFAILSVYIGPMAASDALFAAKLFQTEAFLVALATMFLIIASLEEDRRLNFNLMNSQMATLENAVARISSESNAKNDFIAVLAHELRNPLAPVVSAIDLLKLNVSRDPEEMETLTMMEGRMHIVRRLLDDLLDISRISEGKLAIKKEQVDVRTVLRRAIISTEHHLKERHQALIYKEFPQPLIVAGDPVRLEQVFSNLLTNASKYSDPGNQITLSMKLSTAAHEVMVVVSDEGVGIEPEALQKIFMPFHQVDLGARSKKGLGIGLALVRGFVEMHEGNVVATSKGTGKGSEFTVTLPLFSKNSGSDSSVTTAHSSAPLSREMFARIRNDQDLRVLVVDDNDVAASGIGRLLELRGCAVSYAYDGRQAIEKTASESPDIVLLDLGLPDIEGYEVAKTMRARGYHGKIISLTGYIGEEVREKGSHVGIEQYLVKPAGLAELKRVIPEIS
jgi:signal transduction histidine kinase